MIITLHEDELKEILSAHFRERIGMVVGDVYFNVQTDEGPPETIDGTVDVEMYMEAKKEDAPS